MDINEKKIIKVRVLSHLRSRILLDLIEFINEEKIN